MSSSAETPLTQLLCCPKLQMHDGKLVATSSILARFKESSEALGVYVSASWCTPCKNFTPKLGQLSEKLGQRAQRNDNDDDSQCLRFPVVFVSCDKTPEDFVNYYSSMPRSWLAVPFEERGTRRVPMERFGVNGIPTLLVFDLATGQLITKDGVSAVQADPDGKKFPWAQYTVPWYKSAWFLAILRKLPIFIVVLVMTFWQNRKQKRVPHRLSSGEL